MALTRKFLKEILADYENRDEMINQIIAEHSAVVSDLKDELEKYEEEANEVKRIEMEIGNLKAGDGWKEKYEEICREFQEFRKAEEAKETYKEKEGAFRSMLFEAGVHDRLIDVIVRGSKDAINDLDLQDGKVRNHESALSAIKTDYKDFITDKEPRGVQTTKSAAAAVTRESIMSITDRSERLAAIERNPGLFAV